MAHAQKPDFVFRRNGRVHLNRRGRHFSRLLAAEVCASAVVMLDTPCSEVVWKVLATHCIRQFPLHFPSRASPCAITLQLDTTSIMLLIACHRFHVTGCVTDRTAYKQKKLQYSTWQNDRAKWSENISLSCHKKNHSCGCSRIGWRGT